jgi:hypothetical protein
MAEEQKNTELWTDESGNYYPWLDEFWALTAKREAEFAARGESLIRPISDMPRPKLSFLVNCMTAIRNRPELMSRIKDLARRYPTPEQIPQDESYELGNLISMFLSWLELKDGQDNNFPLPRSSLYGILYNIEVGKAQGSDADVIRQENPPGSFIDDLA